MPFYTLLIIYHLFFVQFCKLNNSILLQTKKIGGFDNYIHLHSSRYSRSYLALSFSMCKRVTMFLVLSYLANINN